ncbi:CHAT domain-containing protein [Candidatus Viridilinea mediisalina]|uniref:CHAT domain-containing protein n=1 Tax=Candidatus Viridilinea mediisalina TaxID=2024553 RepID=A0A2A6RM63_9CHLR|nr:CHAT domain-containing protein [Candidatus Viridilinea mediisalina]PDW03949.1 hypothetical protein CJ255_06235 [Candidatus Viridilinea mediisalina]
MPPDAVDLTLAIRSGAGGYFAEAHLINPQSEAPVTLVAEVALAFDLQGLLALRLDHSSYGKALTSQLFHSPALRAAWQRALALADGLNAPLRLRLRLALNAPELHALRWEALHDPLTDAPLALDERLRLVRELASAETRPLTLAPKPTLRALLAVANPRNGKQYGLAELDGDGEAARARRALGDLPLTLVGNMSGALAQVATLTTIQAALRDGPAIFALVAHAMHGDEGTLLYLEDTAGQVAPTAGAEFAQMLNQLAQPPLLVVLMACEGGGNGYATAALAALGPLLAQAGVGAVVAMQDRLSLGAAREFLPALFRELLRDGQIDRAVAVARSALREGSEWATPALWLRTRSGALWREQVVPPTSPGLHIGGNVGTIQQINVSGGSVGSIIGQQVNTHDTSPAPAGGSSDLITTQRQRLETHRATLAHYLNQLAITGSAHARPEVTHGIRDARAGIARAKAALAALGAPAEHHPDDTE